MFILKRLSYPKWPLAVVHGCKRNSELGPVVRPCLETGNDSGVPACALLPGPPRWGETQLWSLFTEVDKVLFTYSLLIAFLLKRIQRNFSKKWQFC